MTDRELLKQALDALQYASDETKPKNLHGCDCLICKTILALRNRLAQPETPEVTPYVIDCPRCGHCCPQPNQEPAKDKLDFWALFDETQRLRAELKFNTTPPTVQLEQEPVAWMYVNLDGECEQIEYEAPPDDPSVTPLFTTPQQRQWVGLTDDEVQEIMEKTVTNCSELDDFTGYTARMTWKNCEAKLREKNGG
jgi:hypothetical protein